nr:hypothetical protein [Kofleriaceae bacterium]
MAWIAAAVAAGCHPDTPRAGGLPSNLAAVPSSACVHGHDDLDFPVVDGQPESRMRNEIAGMLGATDVRTWSGPPLPSYVPRKLGTQELFVLDRSDAGVFAMYRDPYDVGSCKLRDASNCRYTARLYDASGLVQWSLALGPLLSRGDQLEIQDIRLLDGVLYFNEACQSGSSPANGQCSSLVAVDPRAGSVLWRTKPLVSNDRFRVRGCYIVAGYGFSGEPDTLSVVSRATGKLESTRSLPKAVSTLQLQGRGDELAVTLSSGLVGRFELRGFSTASPQMVLAGDGATGAGPDGSMGGFTYGGAAYGGAAYGGVGYGGVVTDPLSQP